MEKEAEVRGELIKLAWQGGERLPSAEETAELIKQAEAFRLRVNEIESENNTKMHAEQNSLPKRTLAVVIGTIGVYALAERITKRVIQDMPPEKAIWGTRALENLHAVTVIGNAIRGVVSGGKMPNFDYMWSMEIGYYLYEMSKVRGLDRVHHLVSAWAYVYLLRDAYTNKDYQSARRVKFIHAILALLIHASEPLKDFSRYLALYPAFIPLSKVVWIIHHLLYFVRIVEYPIVFYARMKATPELKGQILKGVPFKCLAGSVIFMVLNTIWLYRKLAKFSFPSSKG
jgi:hypothetical protein